MSAEREGGAAAIEARLRGLCDAFNAHDLDRIMAFFAEDCVLEMPRGRAPWGTRAEGAAAVRNALAGRFEGLPDVHYGEAEHFADPAAGTGISKWLLTGTARDGSRTEVRGCDFYTFRDGKVVRKEFLLEDRRALGRRPPPARHSRSKSFHVGRGLLRSSIGSLWRSRSFCRRISLATVASM